MQYLLAVHTVEGAPAPSGEEVQAQYAQVDRGDAEMRSAGVWVFAGDLLPSDGATLVRVEGGATTLTDGPFAETKEQLGGFRVIRCTCRDRARVWAEKCARTCMNPVEVRPFDDPGE